MLTHRQLFPLDRMMPLEAALAGDLQPRQLQVMQAHARQTLHDLFGDKNPNRFEIPLNTGLPSRRAAASLICSYSSRRRTNSARGSSSSRV